MAVNQLMTYAGTSEVFDIGTDTQLDHAFTPSQEAYVQFQQSDDAGVTWTTNDTDILKAQEVGVATGQPANRQYRVRFFGGVGTLRVQFDSQP